MASKAVVASTVLLLSFNLLFFTMVSSTYAPEPSALPLATTTNCPVDTLQFGVCANVLGLVNLQIGNPPTLPCCSVIQGLVDLEAAVCLCTAIKANILGIHLDIPVDLSLVLNDCGRTVPSGYQCA